MLGLLNHRQRDARCLFEQEELPRAREEIQENRAKLVGAW
jgi:Flp pilus assembly protein TadD